MTAQAASLNACSECHNFVTGAYPEPCPECLDGTPYHSKFAPKAGELISTWQRIVYTEYCAAERQFGAFASAHEGYAVIKEELDELWDEIKGNADCTRLAAEAVQVAAMALRFVMDVCTEKEGD